MSESIKSSSHRFVACSIELKWPHLSIFICSPTKTISFANQIDWVDLKSWNYHYEVSFTRWTIIISTGMRTLIASLLISWKKIARKTKISTEDAGSHKDKDINRRCRTYRHIQRNSLYNAVMYDSNLVAIILSCVSVYNLVAIVSFLIKQDVGIEIEKKF